jgi:hypothetical protein
MPLPLQVPAPGPLVHTFGARNRSIAAGRLECALASTSPQSPSIKFRQLDNSRMLDISPDHSMRRLATTVKL